MKKVVLGLLVWLLVSGVFISSVWAEESSNASESEVEVEGDIDIAIFV